MTNKECVKRKGKQNKIAAPLILAAAAVVTSSSGTEKNTSLTFESKRNENDCGREDKAWLIFAARLRDHTNCPGSVTFV